MAGPFVQLDEIIRLALREDLPAGDVTTDATVDAECLAEGRFVARAPCVLAGTVAAARVFALLDAALSVEFSRADGASLARGEGFGLVRGRARDLLVGERTALNLLQRLAGIATQTRRFVDAVAGTGASVVDTRKTTPGLRQLEKAAVRSGGGRNHRSSLSDGVLIKSNHVHLAGSVGEAVRRARAAVPHPLKIEVEVRDLEELEQALAARAEIVLLDNFDPARVRQAVELSAKRCLLEASGGIRLENVRDFAATGVDLISIGALTHSAPAADLAFEIRISGLRT